MTAEPLAKKQTRRTFVQGIAVTAGAGILAPATRSTWAAQPIGANNDLRMAVVGLNGFGRRHIQVYQHLEDVRLVAICDVDDAVLKRESLKLAKLNPGLNLPGLHAEHYENDSN